MDSIRGSIRGSIREYSCIAIGALLVTSCAAERPLTTQDLELKVYIDRFQTLYGKQANVDAYFGPLPYPDVGHCSIMGDRPNTITVDPTNWSYLRDTGKEELMFHELGHCVLGLGHDMNVIVLDGVHIYESIMYPMEFGNESFYSRFQDYYRQELISLKPENTIYEDSEK